MAINFAVDKNNVLSATLSHEINALQSVGEIPVSSRVQEMVNKKVGELNMITAALQCISTFKNTKDLSVKLAHDLKNMRQSSSQFDECMQRCVNDYHELGFDLAEMQILVYTSLTKKTPHRPAPPPPPTRGASTIRSTITRPSVAPPPPPKPRARTLLGEPTVDVEQLPPPPPFISGGAASLGAIPRRGTTLGQLRGKEL